MPVLDHPTHEKTIGGERYGCHGKPRRPRCHWAKEIKAHYKSKLKELRNGQA